MKYIFQTLLLLTILSGIYGQTSDTMLVKEEAGIKKVLNDFIDAWNKHDAKAFSNVFSRDADFTNVAGKSARGRK